MSNLRRANTSFEAQVDAIVVTTEKRMVALMRQSLQDVVNEAQQPVAKGGRMRVDTGFLRASGQSSLNGMPTGLSIKPSGATRGSIPSDTQQTVATLGKMKFGQVFHFGWTANYAKYRELYDGFLEGALQHWSRIVTFNTDTIRQRIK